MTAKTSKVVYLVVGVQGIAFLVCVGCLCGTLFYKNYSDPVVLTALVSLTASLGGNLGSILGGPRAMMTMASEIADKIAEKTLKTKTTNPPDDPVQVEQVTS